MASQMWSSFHQIRRVFNWRDILEVWNYTGDTSSYIQTVRLNLSVLDNSSMPVTHFLTFLNYEQDGLSWFLYEIINLRGGGFTAQQARLEYIKHILLKIENLDANFPAFPSSPVCTIREYVETQLGYYELDYVEMMPRLIPLPDLEPQYQPISLSNSTIMIRVINNKISEKMDDIIYITRSDGFFDFTFNIIYHDQMSGTKTKTEYIGRNAVLNYLSNTLRMMSLDMEPFDSVQFLMPNAPSVVIPVSQLTSQTRDLIYDTVDHMMDYWPRKM